MSLVLSLSVRTSLPVSSLHQNRNMNIPEFKTADSKKNPTVNLQAPWNQNSMSWGGGGETAELKLCNCGFTVDPKLLRLSLN